MPGFKSHRADRNSDGGGIMAYIRDDIPHRRRHDFEDIEKSPVETIYLYVLTIPIISINMYAVMILMFYSMYHILTRPV